jgi:DNA-binding winged helix-turn-helix (wHTH) protein
MDLQFGDVRIESAARRVWRGASTVHLTRKAFDLLVLLIERRPDTVSREQIHAHLWPGTFVSESSLQALVSEIRQALGDDGRRRAIIRTVHGVGYAFDPPLDAPAAPSQARAGEVLAWLVGQFDRLPLHAGDNVLGREGDEVIRIEDSTVSRRHARVTVADQVWVEDLGSKNGTWVRDTRVVAPVALTDGTVVCFGSVRFTLRLVRPGASTDSVPLSSS